MKMVKKNVPKNGEKNVPKKKFFKINDENCITNIAM